MDRIVSVQEAGSWGRSAEADTVTLTAHDRHRRRVSLTSDGGKAFLLDLPRAVQLAEGDGLILPDGTVIRVVAAPEPVLEITAGSAGLPTLAYHLGNRHLAIQILEGRLLIAADPVIAAMLEGLGGKVQAVQRPFQPERGAYHKAGENDHHHHEP